MPFSTISNISISAKNLNSSSVFFWSAYHANAGADKKYTVSGSDISMHLLQNILKALADNSVSICWYRSWNSSKFYTPLSFQSFCKLIVSICNFFHCQIVIGFCFIWEWRSNEFLLTIHVFLWINTFSQH